MRFSLISILLLAGTFPAVADRATLDETKTELAFRMPTPPVIDGVIEDGEWQYAGQRAKSGDKGWFWQVRFDDRLGDDGQPVVADSIRGGANGDGAVLPPVDKFDLNFVIFVGYDDTNLYVAVRVEDDTLISDSAEADSNNGNTWLDDSVEVFIDGDNSNFPSRDTTGSNPELVDTGGQFVITINNAHRDMEAGSPGYGPNAVWFAKTATRADGTGYDAEFRIALSKIGNPKFGDIIGFSVAVNDDDDGGSGDKQLMWAGKPHVEASYGNLIFGGKSYTAPKVTQAPVIDGTINAAEYAGAEEIHVDPHTGIYDLREGDDDFPLTDHGFTARVVHDDEAIYVAIDALDDLIRNDNAEPDSENGNTWDDDSVEIYFDANDSNDIDRGSSGFEGQYVFTANRARRTAEANNPTFGAAGDWFAANKITATGYSTEFKVKKSGLFNPADGATLGFHIDMNDDDGNLNKGRKGQIGWSGRSHSEFTYGVLKLAPGTSSAKPFIQKIALVGDQIELTIQSQAPLPKHSLQRASQLSPAQWNNTQATFTAGGAGTVVARFPKPSGNIEFYRVLIVP